jgi:hypothetical protein
VFGASPCGCEVEERADGKSLVERKAAAKQAELMRARWGCPGRYSDAIPKTAKHLGRSERAVLAGVQRLTGDGDWCTTCPRKYAALSFVRRAATLHFYVEKGCPGWIEPTPPKTLVQAVEAIGHGVAKYAQHVADEMRAQSEALKKKRGQGPR